MDYGVQLCVDVVYELETKHKSAPAFAARASLMDVVYLHTVRCRV